MIGKILKIKDVNMSFNQKEKNIVVFACFSHVKYNENYIIFTNKDEYGKGILYYGTIHTKDNTIIIFDVKQDKENVIFDFINKLTSNFNYAEYKVIDITNFTQAEIISNNEKNVGSDFLTKLDNLTIEKPKVDLILDEKKETLAYLYFTLIVFIILLFGAIYIYINRDIYLKRYENVACTLNNVDDELNANYSEKIYLRFNQKSELTTIKHNISYEFYNKKDYNNFKYNNMWIEYDIDKYKFDDDKLMFIYNNTDNVDDNYKLITSYDEVISYYEELGYKCFKEK